MVTICGIHTHWPKGAADALGDACFSVSGCSVQEEPAAVVERLADLADEARLQDHARECPTQLIEREWGTLQRLAIDRSDVVVEHDWGGADEIAPGRVLLGAFEAGLGQLVDIVLNAGRRLDRYQQFVANAVKRFGHDAARHAGGFANDVARASAALQ